MLSAVRFWTIMGLRVFDEIPDEYLPVQYGPTHEDDDSAEDAVNDDRDARARAVADELMAG
ncbi:hypothetical protein [Gordonia sp. (in: high G+C Gram-positive bacteria)]|uniref:hypothetical protein n=1 Tax=Gordonia sp. (in: high G+C Gram-positive bacteria) TaxID=84139 RepID=UPI003F9799BE